MKIVRNLMASLFLGLTLTSLAPADTEFVPPSEYAKYATVRLTADLSHIINFILFLWKWNNI